MRSFNIWENVYAFEKNAVYAFEKNAVFLGSRFAKKTISFWDTNLASTNSNNEPEPELKPETQPNIVNLTAHYEPVLFSELVSLKIQIRSCTLI